MSDSYAATRRWLSRPSAIRYSARRNANRSLCTWKSAFSRLSLTSRSFELVLERCEARGDVADLLLQPADPAGDVVDLLPERRFLLLRRGDPVLESRDPRVHRLLAVDDVGACGRCDDEQGDQAEGEAAHPAGFGGGPGDPARPGLPRGLCGALGRVRLGHDHGPGRLVRDGLWLGDDHRPGRIGGNGRRLGHRLRDDGRARRWVVSRGRGHQPAVFPRRALSKPPQRPGADRRPGCGSRRRRSSPCGGRTRAP